MCCKIQLNAILLNSALYVKHKLSANLQLHFMKLETALEEQTVECVFAAHFFKIHFFLKYFLNFSCNRIHNHINFLSNRRATPFPIQSANAKPM